MNPRILSKETGIPVRAIRELEKNGVINVNNDFTDDNYFFLQTLAKCWGNRELIRQQVAPMNLQERAVLLFGAGHNKVERYMIHRFLAHRSDKQDDCNIGNLHVSQVVDEVLVYYSIPESKRRELTATAYKIRKKIYNMVHRSADLCSIAKNLTSYKRRNPRKSTIQKLQQQSVMSAEAVRNLLGY